MLVTTDTVKKTVKNIIYNELNKQKQEGSFYRTGYRQRLLINNSSTNCAGKPLLNVSSYLLVAFALSLCGSKPKPSRSTLGDEVAKLIMVAVVPIVTVNNFGRVLETLAQKLRMKLKVCSLSPPPKTIIKKKRILLTMINYKNSLLLAQNLTGQPQKPLKSSIILVSLTKRKLFITAHQDLMFKHAERST